MKTFSTYLLTILLLFVFNSAHAQSTKNFYELQEELNQYYSDKKIDFSGDGEWKQFKRWEHFMQQRVYPSGYLDPTATWTAYEEEMAKPIHKSENDKAGSWTYMGAGNYAGRVNCVIVDPNDTNTYWLGGASSGIWKSTNRGASWVDMSNNIPVLTIADIVINPTNSNEIYVATGDNFGWEYSSTFFGYTMGVLKSTDGGNTWNTTGLSWNLPQSTTMRRMVSHPNSPNTLICATSTGIYTTTNGGVNWNLTKSGNVLDLEYHPTNNNIVYAVTDSIFRSIDGGASWNWLPGTPIFTNPVSYKLQRVSVEATPAAPNNVYVMYSWQGNGGWLYKSTNQGLTFDSITPPTNSQVNNFLGYWTGVLEVSHVDTNRIIVGGTSLAVTTDEGTNWLTTSNNYVDQHAVTFLPDGVSYIGGNDGGCYRRDPFLTSLNNGLQLVQIYRMGGDPSNSNVAYTGRQDGGTLKYLGGVNSWTKVYGNDGTEAIVDYTNSNIVYGSYQFGNYAKSTNAGGSFTQIPVGNGLWLAPMVIHPTNPLILFYGGTSEMEKSIDGGLSWNNISSTLPATYSMDVAPSDPNTIYAASTWSTINKTSNGGTNWLNISFGLPFTAISHLAVSATDPNKIWAVFSGFLAGEKVYKSTNGGPPWTNVSGSLPNIPINCIEYDDQSTREAIYIGTDIGVYYKDNTLSDWVYFSTGLPNVIVTELEIHYASGMIRAATHGRGLWESPLQNVVGVENTITPTNTVSVFPNPTEGQFNIDLNLTETTDINISVSNTLGQVVYQQNLSTQFKRVSLDLSGQSNGIYFVNVNGLENRVTRKIIKQ